MKKLITICFFAFLYSSSGVVFPSYYRPPVHFGPILGMTSYISDNNIDFKNRELLPKNLPEMKGYSYSYGLSLFTYEKAYLDLSGEEVTFPWSFTWDLTYNSNFLSSNLSILDPMMNNRLVDFNENEQDSSSTLLNYTNEIVYSHIELDVDISYQIFEKIPIHISYNQGFQFAIKNNIKEFIEISSDNSNLKFKEIENTKLENDNRKLILIDEEIPEFNEFVLPIGIGASYDLILKRHSFIRLNYTFETNFLGYKNQLNNYLIHKFEIAWYFVL